MDEVKKHLDDSYSLFLNKYNRRAIHVSKKKIDQLYETTRSKLSQEELDYKNKQHKYSIFPNDEMRKFKFISEIDTLVKNNDKQMRLYIDEKYIHSMMAGEDEEENKQDIPSILLSTNRTLYMADDELAKKIGGIRL